MLLIKAGRLIDGTGRKPLEKPLIVIEGDVIKEIIADEENACSDDNPSYEVINALGKTAIPGLIDAHVHLTFSGGPDPLQDLLNENDDLLILRALRNAQLSLSAGVTTVRDCGARHLFILTLRDAIAKGLVVGPRLVVSGMPITTTGGHCYFLGLEADTPTEIRKAGRGLLKAGTDFLKVMVSGGNMTPGSGPHILQYDAAELRELVDEAHAHGKKVAAHVHSTAAIRNALKAGIDTLEHCGWQGRDGLDYDTDLVAEMAARGTYVCPAISGPLRVSPEEAAADPERAAFWRRFQGERFETIQKMLAAGVKIIAGSDAGVRLTKFEDYPALLELMVHRLRMKPMQVIEAATRIAAEALGLHQRIGTIEPGKKADLVLLEGNPLEDIRNIRRINRVFKDGKMVVLSGKQHETALEATPRLFYCI